MDASSPPRYRRNSSRSGPAPLSGSELPAYTRRSTQVAPRQSTEHLFHVFNGKGKPWITLKLFSSAKSSKSLPTFFEKEKINGLLELDAEKGDSIKAITATVTGRIITGSNIDDSFVFLNQVQSIWAKSPDSRARTPSPSDDAPSNKLLGHCVWPLSIPIPRTVNAPTGDGGIRSFRLPETFLERHTRVSIQYDLTIDVSRGKLRADNRIKTAFGYVPSIRPDPPSLLRQLAYQQFLPLPGPLLDPEGWKMLRPATVRGVAFKTYEAEARCTLSLSKPLCYARGALLPCFIALEGRNPQVLDLLSAPGSIVLSLRRRVRFYNPGMSSTKEDIAWNETVEDMGSAVWWPSSDTRNDSTTRYLEGEIRLAKDLRPTSEMGHFSISYTVVLFPFNVLGFTSDPTTLLSEPVTITTMNAKGPRPNAYAPPAYDAPGPRNNNDTYVPTYNAGSISLL